MSEIKKSFTLKNIKWDIVLKRAQSSKVVLPTQLDCIFTIINSISLI